MQELKLIGIGLFGVLFYHLLKIRALRHRSENLKIEITPYVYFTKEWDNVMLSVIALIGIAIGYKQGISAYLKYKPATAQIVIDFCQWIFFFVGMAGTNIVVALFGRLDKLINKEVKQNADVVKSVEENKLN